MYVFFSEEYFFRFYAPWKVQREKSREQEHHKLKGFRMKRRLFSLLGVSLLVGMFGTILFTTPVFAAGTSTPTALCGQWQGWTPAEMLIPDASHSGSYVGEMAAFQDSCGNKAILGWSWGGGTISISSWSTTTGAWYDTSSSTGSGNWWSDVLPSSYNHFCVSVTFNSYDGTHSGSACYP